MAIKIYEYADCSTCKQGLKFLDSKKVRYEKVAIVEQPPTVDELNLMLSHLEAVGGTFKNLFNTSGLQYRELKISEKIKSGLKAGEAIKLLSKNGKLIKRPFLLTAKNGAVGFKPEVWSKVL